MNIPKHTTHESCMGICINVVYLLPLSHNKNRDNGGTLGMGAP